MGENDALYERNKEKNFDKNGNKMKGLHVGGFNEMINQPVEESEQYNKNGRQKHDIVEFTDAQHIRQLNFAKYSTPFKASYLAEMPLIDDGSTEEVNL